MTEPKVFLFNVLLITGCFCSEMLSYCIYIAGRDVFLLSVVTIGDTISVAA